MATVKDFLQLGEMDGVARYILLRNDGSIISGNFEDPDAVSQAIVSVGELCDSFPEDLGNRRYLHLCAEQSNGESIFIFSLGAFYLGIIKHNDTDPVVLSESILSFLKALA